MHHIAQMNIARLREPLDHPHIKDFVDNLDRINKLAERSPGFIWRLQGDSGNSTDIQAYDNPLIIINMTVWESLEDLREFVFQSAHVEFLRRRREWFEPMEGPYQVLWWVPRDHVPSIQEGKIRLSHLQKHGDTVFAFGFNRPFGPDARLIMPRVDRSLS